MSTETITPDPAPRLVLGKPAQPKTLSRRDWMLALFGVVALATFVRLFHHSSNNDVFIDEITYAHITRNLAAGHGVSLFGQNFYLHPPAYFYVADAFLKIFGEPAGLLATVLRLRILNGVIGAIGVGLITVLVTRVSNRTWGLLAGLLAALDPFILLWDGRVLLESLAMTSALAGWCLLTLVAGPEARDLNSQDDGRPPLVRTLGISALAGLFFGVSLLSKETYAFVGVAAMIAAAILGRPFRRVVSVTAAVVGIACFLVYLLTLLVQHRLTAWWLQVSAGLRRASGTEQISGFNQTGHSSFTSRILGDLGLYAVSYIIIGLIALSLVLELRLLWIRHRCKRTTPAGELMVALLAAGAALYVTYAVAFGAFEEQIFYMFEVSGLPLLALWTARAWRAQSRLSARAQRGLLCSACLIAVGAASAVDVYVRSSGDTDIIDLQRYVTTHLPRRAVIDTTDGVSEYLLGTRIIVMETTVAGLRTSTVRYVVINRSLNEQGYVKLSAGFVPFLNRAGRVIFRTRDRSTGPILLYELRRPADQLTPSGEPVNR